MPTVRGVASAILCVSLAIVSAGACAQQAAETGGGVTAEFRAQWPHWPYMVDELPEEWPFREEGPADAAPSGLYAGVAREDISPVFGISQMAWGSAVHIESDGIDPVGMYATALVLSDGEQKFAMVDIDIGSVGGMEHIVERAAVRTGIPAGHIRLGASHTHAGPGLGSGKGPAGIDLEAYRPMIERHQAMLADKIVAAIYAADRQLRPVHMYGGRGTGSINVNRRFRGHDGGPPAVGLNFDEFVDRELVVFRIDDVEGKPYAVIVNFQAHGTVLAYANTKISPDWIGMTRKAVETAMPGVTALYFQGAAGNQGPIEGFTGDLGVAHRLGARLGYEAAAIALGIDTVKRVPRFEGYMESTAHQAKQPWRVEGPRDQTLKSISRIVEVPGREIDPKEMRELRQEVERSRRAVARFSDADQSAEAMQARARLRRYANRLERWESFVNRTEPVTVEIRMLRIGDLVIVSMPGEQFAEIGAAIKKASPFAYTMFAGYSSQVGGGYMPTAEEFDHGGYEVWGTRYGHGAAAEVIRVATAMYEELR